MFKHHHQRAIILRGTPRLFAAVAAGHASSVPSRPKLPPPEDPPARSRSRSASGLSNVIRGSPAAGKFVPSPAPPRLGPSEDSPAAQPPSTQVSPYSPWYLATLCPSPASHSNAAPMLSHLRRGTSPRPLLRVTPQASASLTTASHPRLPPFFASPTHQSLAASPASCRLDATKKPLQQPYDGPFTVIKRTRKNITIDRHGKSDVIAIDRVKPAYLLRPDPPPTNTVSVSPSPVLTDKIQCRKKHVSTTPYTPSERVHNSVGPANQP
ncbi:proline-rich protein 36-like [Eriocheir sinensis]|uniref:proline-rich protein 36-like n=1 Tax=Eriocheir sinensis TaxID=95602 RepID=UPI0021C7973F|nr:proline-rich protein 36-like [Eriocheir sinensis]